MIAWLTLLGLVVVLIATAAVSFAKIAASLGRMEADMQEALHRFNLR